MRWTVFAVAALLLAAVTGWAVLHWFIVPRIDDFRPRLTAWASQALGAPVTIGALTVQSNALLPAIAVQDVRVLGPEGQAALHVPHALVVFSVASLLRGGLEQLVIDAPEITLRRTAQGRLLIGGIDVSGDKAADTGAVDWVFSQEEIAVRGARVHWLDDVHPERAAALWQQVDAVLRNGLRRHQLRLDATPDGAWGERFTLIGRFRQPLLDLHAGRWQSWDGQLYASVPRVEAAPWAQLLDASERWGVSAVDGRAALRVWAEIRHGVPVEATADVALGDATATLAPGLPPLALAQLRTRLVWRALDGGFQLSTQGLQFTEVGGRAWPGGNFQVSHRASGGALRGDRLDLAALSRMATRLPLPADVRQRAEQLDAAGLVEHVDASWSGPLTAPTGWRVQAAATGLRVAAQARAAEPNGHVPAGVPGLEGVALQLEAGPSGGRASVTLREGALEFPGVFEEPRIPLAQLSAKLQWRVQGERIEVQADDVELASPDAAGRFKGRWHTGEAEDGSGARFPGVLDLQGAFSRANAARVYRYLPLSLPVKARNYVRDAIRKGEGRDVVVRVQGKLHELPFNLPGERGTFRIAGPLSGVQMQYVPQHLQPAGQASWPALEGLSGELIFEGAGMRVRGGAARVQGHPGWRFDGIEAEIADFKHTDVVVQAQGRGALAAALDIVRNSPVAQFTHHALDAARASGDAALELKLELPVKTIEQSKVQGRVLLAANDLRLAPGAPPLAQAAGTVTFSESGFAIDKAQAQLLGGGVVVSGGTVKGAAAGAASVQVTARGNASAEGLRQSADWGADWAAVAALARQASGSTAYEAVVGFPEGGADVHVRSDLRGLALNLPAPLDKPQDAAWPLHVELGPLAGSAGRERLRVRLADRLALDYERQAGAAGAPARVLRGAIAVGALGEGAAAAPALPAAGVQAQLKWPALDVDAWERALDRMGEAAPAPPQAATSAATPPAVPAAAPAPAADEYLPTRVAVQVDTLQVDDRTLHAVDVNATRNGTRWSAQVQARELAGRVEYTPGADGSAGAVHARLSRLAIAASDTPESGALEQPSTRIPALDVVVDDFELHGRKLGRLEVQAVNRDVGAGRAAGGNAVQEWQLTRLALAVPEASLSASGRWAAQPRAPALPTGARSARSADDQRRTALDFSLDVRDAGALLARFGMAGVLRGGKGKIDGQLGWVGTPFSPHYASMDGQLHVDVGAGQFLKADPGIAKLLGVLSLQALPRRLTLDFRDVFSAGFAFDFVRGDAKVEHGVLRTQNLQMKGVNAAVLMDGSVDLDHETQKLRVLVVPEIDAGTAALATALINPAIGLGAFVAQLVLKQPLIQAATREFEITGRWDNPEIVPVKASAPVPAASSPKEK